MCVTACNDPTLASASFLISFMTLSKEGRKAEETIAGIEENAADRHFVLFAQSFLSFQNTV